MRKEWRTAAALSILILLMLIIELGMISLPAAAGLLITTVSADTEDSIEIDVSPGEEGRQTIDGTVECQTTNPITPVTVSLTAVSTVGTATLDKPSMVFQGNHQSEDFRVSIAAYSADASDEHTCTVSGSWQQGGSSGSTNSAVTQIIILPFSLCNITCDDPEKQVNKGDSVSFTVNLKNEGNCDDEYIVDIANIGELESKGITVDDIGNVVVPNHESREVTVKVHVPSDTTEKVCRVDFVVIGTADEDREQFPFALHARIDEGLLSTNNPLSMIVIVVVIASIISGVYFYTRKKRGEKDATTPPNQ